MACLAVIMQWSDKYVNTSFQHTTYSSIDSILLRDNFLTNIDYILYSFVSNFQKSKRTKWLMSVMLMVIGTPHS